jgi:hypothetical protein
MKQLHGIKKVIERKNLEEREFHAGLHNKKMQGAIKPNIVSPKREKEQEQQAHSLMARMRKRHQDGKRSGTTDKDQRDS